jgi:SAM-dependent methyltransferase
MPPLHLIRGLRFPDDYVIKMFFKEGLHLRPGRVLELGCGSGNNLMLFKSFGWDVVGVDVNPESLADARFNLADSGQPAILMQTDLSHGFPVIAGLFDAVILPSFNYYVSRSRMVELFSACSKLLKRPGGMFFLRSRTLDDWRYGRGIEVERNGYLLQCTETGEEGLLNVFYSAQELIEIMASTIGELQGQQILKTRCENPQHGSVITNDDLVFWGRCA